MVIFTSPINPPSYTLYNQALGICFLSNKVVIPFRSREYEQPRSFSFHQLNNPLTNTLGKINTYYAAFFEAAPILNTTMKPPLYVWLLILITLLCLQLNRREWCVFLLPLWLILLVNLIGPANGFGYFRYTYPLALCIPTIIGFVFCSKSRVGISKRKQ